MKRVMKSKGTERECTWHIEATWLSLSCKDWSLYNVTMVVIERVLPIQFLREISIDLRILMKYYNALKKKIN